jgi:hypothetical protein
VLAVTADDTQRLLDRLVTLAAMDLAPLRREVSELTREQAEELIVTIALREATRRAYAGLDEL